jgi:ribosomal-protein-alanine N-acetyltransferase
VLFKIDQSCFSPEVAYSRDELGRFIRGRGAKTWVAEASGEIIAFLVAGSERGRVGHIVTIDVVAGWRRRGVGRALMDAVERWGEDEGLRVIYLETAVSNEVAQTFYLARGYERRERVDNYYGNGEAAWVMVKWLMRR